MNKVLKAIRERLGHASLKWEPSLWLDTTIPELNETLGHAILGLPFGRIIEITGRPSQGKTAIMMALAALAQRSGSHVVWGDLENSFDPDWALQRGMMACPKCKGESAKKFLAGEEMTCSHCGGSNSPTRGLDTDKLTLIQPYVGFFSGKDPKTGRIVKEKKARLAYGEELLQEIAEVISSGEYKSCFGVLDSVSAVLTEAEAKTDLKNSSMKTDLELARAMSRLLRRWVGMLQVYNGLFVLVNQLREGPSKGGYGDNSKTTGGNAPTFYAHVRVKVSRVKGSKIIEKGKVVGIRGVMTCTKNKTGGSEGMQCGYRIFFKGPIEFVPAKEVSSDGDE